MKNIAFHVVPGDHKPDFISIGEKDGDPETVIITTRVTDITQSLEVPLQALFLLSSQIRGHLCEVLEKASAPTADDLQAMADAAHQEHIDAQRDDRTP